MSLTCMSAPKMMCPFDPSETSSPGEGHQVVLRPKSPRQGPGQSSERDSPMSLTENDPHIDQPNVRDPPARMKSAAAQRPDPLLKGAA